jgi:hypothetical protein
LRVLTPIISELTQALDASTAAIADGGVVGDVKENDENDITKGVAGLKIGMVKPPIDSDSIESKSVGAVAHISKEQLLQGKVLKLKSDIKKLTKENEMLKRYVVFLSGPPVESASPDQSAAPASVEKNEMNDALKYKKLAHENKTLTKQNEELNLEFAGFKAAALKPIGSASNGRIIVLGGKQWLTRPVRAQGRRRRRRRSRE